jgi:2-(1,2-epoxy-1,2-dihydrophenyl)acetyl-CoA isomerase
MAVGRQELVTGTPDLRAQLQDAVLLLTLDRPRARNALSLAMLDALGAQLDWARSAPEVRVVVLTGAGAGFCAGGDLKVMAEGRSIYGTPDQPEERAQRQMDVQRATSVALWEFPKPTLALVNGAAVGAGLALALACDVRVAGESASLRSGFTAIGLAGDFGCTWLLNRLVGPSRAKDMLLFAQPLDSRRALDWGLVNEIVPDEQLLSAGLARARRLVAAPQTALVAVKEHVLRAAGADLATCADAEVRRHVQLMAGEEHQAAVRRLLGGMKSAATGS